MDAIALLQADHRKVRQLLARLAKTTERSTTQREQLLTQIEKEVKIHTAIEEEIFYPAFKEAVRSKSDAHLYFEALEEHHVVDMVLPEIKAADTDSEEFGAKAKVLKDLIEHHAEEEETQMFPKARKAMGMARLLELGQELQERKQQLGTSLWERAVSSIARRRRAA
ncbi:MAG TPA: hemerythrin domain-containing protein [Terriglobia bacterium]|nr:hemerythrin domain-containing protein [Terriglobia bacterium]